MLQPMPSRILTDTLTLYVPGEINRYQSPTATPSVVQKVHLQNSNETRKTSSNTEVVLRSLLFVDARKSFPQFDYIALQENAQKAGAQMTCTITHKNGTVEGPFTVKTVDAVPDDTGNLHHTEMGLV